MAPALALMLAASAATAQDGSEGAAARTPEAAQEFLAAHLMRGGWQAESYAWHDGSVYRFYKNGWQEAPVREMRMGAQDGVYGDIASVESPDACTTVLTVTINQLTRHAIEDQLKPIPSTRVVARIDWRNADTVKVEQQSIGSRERGESVTLRGFRVIEWDNKVKAGIMFLTQEKSNADRVAFAMNYLREKCDPTAGSPF